LEERRNLLRRDALSIHWWGQGALGDVAREDVLGAVKIHTELEVVDFSSGVEIAVFADDQIEDILRWRHKT
jgi:predicted hydrolase (HD superfamily)